MLLSINQLSDLTGKDRRTVTKKLEDLPHKDGDKGGHEYDSVEALARLYSQGNLEAARADQARTIADLNRIRQQDLERKRIPIEIIRGVLDEAHQSYGATLKAAEGRELTAELINELFGKFRGIPAQLKW